ncbi:nucleotidyl transferase AbiEii/AbiGii toxin family protein [Streptomyces sp. HMX87]|uniref:nucleotidyl transferase AbiEii/AbiGii toxin family protein n=1 Tax=Streptomyces sp. HMX87 TaxID=3390849 RepID=UPI003A880CA7
MAEPPQSLPADLLAAGAPYGLLLAGGHAARVHGLVERAGRGVTVASDSSAEMAEIADGVCQGLVERGWLVPSVETDPLSARLVVGEPVTGAEFVVDVVKEVLWGPPVRADVGPVLSLEDLIGTRVRALVDRGLARDLVDVHAASRLRSRPELEELGRRHALDAFDLADLQARLTGADWVDDAEFAACGLDAGAVAGLRRWAQEWADDIAERLAESEAPDDA